MLPDEIIPPESGATFPLSGQGLNDWLNTAGQFLFSEIPDGAQLYDFLRNNGVSIPVADFYNIRAQVLLRNDLINENETSLTTLADQFPDSLVPLGYTVSEHGYDLSSNFLYRFRVEGVNPDTGETQFTYMAVGSDRQLTFQEARDRAGSLHFENYLDKGFVETDFAIDAAFVRPEFLE